MDEIFKISPDKERAEDLLEMSKERIHLIKRIPKDKTYKIIEDYYEIIKELLTSVMYIDGFKTLSHVKLIEYFSNKYDILTNSQIEIVESMRKIRHGIVYYGKKISSEFLDNKKEEIDNIIKLLIKLVEEKLRKK